MNTLRIQTQGEQIRNLLALRLKEYDRNIERVQSAIRTGRADLERAEIDMKTRAASFENVVRSPVGLGRHHDISTSIGGGDVLSARVSIDKYENVLATLQYARTQVQWLSEQFTPSKPYELDAGDLAMLGVGVLGGNISIRGGGFDPLDL